MLNSIFFFIFLERLIPFSTISFSLVFQQRNNTHHKRERRKKMSCLPGICASSYIRSSGGRVRRRRMGVAERKLKRGIIERIALACLACLATKVEADPRVDRVSLRFRNACARNLLDPGTSFQIAMGFRLPSRRPFSNRFVRISFLLFSSFVCFYLEIHERNHTGKRSYKREGALCRTYRVGD